MKKFWKISAVIVALIAVWLGATYYSGVRTEAQITDVVKDMNTELARTSKELGLQVKQISYERGFFSSHARFGLTSDLLARLKLGNVPVPWVEFDATFAHGPFSPAAWRHGNFLPQLFQAHVETAATGLVKMVVGAIMNGRSPWVMDVGCGYGHHCAGTSSIPAIDFDLSMIQKNAKLDFGGIQMKFDSDGQSGADYKFNGEAQLLPLLIADQNFGSGQITMQSDAQSATEVYSWKTDQGAGKLTLAATFSKPVGGDASLSLDDLIRLIKTFSGKLEVSTAMLIDLAARGQHLADGDDLNTIRQQVTTEINAALADPDTAKLLKVQGDQITSDWLYADGKLTINGKDSPDVLEAVKQGYQEQMQQKPEDLGRLIAPPASSPEHPLPDD